jgi:hypothetical protein
LIQFARIHILFRHRLVRLSTAIAVTVCIRGTDGVVNNNEKGAPMKKLIILTGLATLAAAAMFVGLHTTVQTTVTPPDANITVGQSQTGPALAGDTSKPVRPMLRRATPLPVESWDAF